MLDALRGILLNKQDDYATIDATGLIFRVEIPSSSLDQLPEVGNEATLFTRLRLNVNEGYFDLYGFATETERECFDILTGMSGIGPRKGLMILSQIDIAAFANAIISGDLAYISRIKGIGKKTAERLVVELREKMAPISKQAAQERPATAILPAVDNVKDAVEALIVLGCRPPVAEKAVSEALKELGEDAPTESLIRLGLKNRA